MYKRVITFCMWVRKLWVGAPGGRVGDQCHSVGTGVFPETPEAGVSCCGGWQAGAAGKTHPEVAPSSPVDKRAESRVLPCSWRRTDRAGKAAVSSSFPMTSPDHSLASSSVPSSAASISIYKAFPMHRIREVGKRPTQSWSCREEEILQ